MHRLLSSLFLAGLVWAIAWPSLAVAHAVDDSPTLATAWTFSPWLHLPLAALVLLYAWGLARLWRRAGWGGALRPAHALAFLAGIVAMLLATLWPLDALGNWSLAAHMGQHVLLIAFAPPLLLAGRPFAAMALVLPKPTLQSLHHGLAARLRTVLLALVPATVVHVAVMWGWHLPAALAAALANEAVHWLMHASFLLAGLWFWATVLHRLREPGIGVVAGLVALVTVMMQMGLMGGLLTFANRPLYADYGSRAPQLGLDVLSDQQLAGLIMWVPACLPYLVVAMWLLWLALGRDAARRPAG